MGVQEAPVRPATDARAARQGRFRTQPGALSVFVAALSVVLAGVLTVVSATQTRQVSLGRTLVERVTGQNTKLPPLPDLPVPLPLVNPADPGSSPAPDPQPTGPAAGPTTGGGQPAPSPTGTAGASPAPAPAPSSNAPQPGTVQTAALPFNWPASVSPSSSRRMLFAHYFTPYLISVDNKPANDDYYTVQYLNPNGERGKHAAYGGLLRDRPTARAPMSSSDYKQIDMQTDIRQAIAGGLDGFTLDLLSANPSSYNYERASQLMDVAAATNRNFRILLMPDMASLSSIDTDGMAKLITTLGSKPAAYHLPDGRLVVSPFKAEGRSASWWRTTLQTVRSKYGINVAFVPCFLNYRANAQSFAPISYGFSLWGNRNPAGQTKGVSDADYAHSLGKIWMQPVSVQDERPNQGVFDEAANTENLRDSWQAAIDGNADWVQIPTWNDYSEGAQLAPSAKHGFTFLDISSWFAVTWKTGAAPQVVRDTLYVTHRTQPVSAQPSFPETKLMRLRSGSTPARDTVEVLSVLTAPATVNVAIGSNRYSYTAPAGMSSKLFPLATGTVSAAAVRDGAVTTAVTSPYKVVADPTVQDLQYVGASSRR